MKAATSHAIEMFKAFLSDQKRARNSEAKLKNAVQKISVEEMAEYVRLTNELMHASEEKEQNK